MRWPRPHTGGLAQMDRVDRVDMDQMDMDQMDMDQMDMDQMDVDRMDTVPGGRGAPAREP